MYLKTNKNLINKMTQFMFPKYVESLAGGLDFLITRKDRKGIVVFDIDDTLLLPDCGTGIPETVFFYNFVKDMGYKTVIITARIAYPENVDRTLADLKNIGVDNFESIYFRSETNTDVPRFKMVSRKNVNERYKEKVIMSVGDMIWDIGKYGGVGILLSK